MFSMLYSTTDSEESAERISTDLLERRLAACANIIPIRSMYLWKGRIERAKEFAIILKTRKELVDEAMTSIRRMHGYEKPCIVSYDMEKGDKDYLDWIVEETSGAR